MLMVDIIGSGEPLTYRLRSRKGMVERKRGRIVAVKTHRLTLDGIKFSNPPPVNRLPLRPGRRYEVQAAPQGPAELILLCYGDGKRLGSVRLPLGKSCLFDVHPGMDQATVAVEVREGTELQPHLTVRLVEIGVAQPVANPLLLIGAMKAGTTTLYQYLIQHPKIFPNRISKEPHFFSDSSRPDFDPLEYATQYEFDATLGHNFALDASTHYAKYPLHPGVPERIAVFPGDFKFLYLLRNPFERIESHLAHNSGRRGTSSSDAAQWRHAIDTSRYAMQLDRYFSVLNQPRVLLLDFEELKHSPMALVRRVESFLGIEPFTYHPIGVTNRRKDTSVVLSDEQRQQIRAALADDIEELVVRYGFTAARSWLAGH